VGHTVEARLGVGHIDAKGDYVRTSEFRAAEYLYTIDYAGAQGHAEISDQHKSHHVLWVDNRLMCLPNNKLRWSDPSWIKPYDDSGAGGLVHNRLY
jgi:hypothetical protein